MKYLESYNSYTPLVKKPRKKWDIEELKKY